MSLITPDNPVPVMGFFDNLFQIRSDTEIGRIDNKDCFRILVLIPCLNQIIPSPLTGNTKFLIDKWIDENRSCTRKNKTIYNRFMDISWPDDLIFGMKRTPEPC